MASSRWVVALGRVCWISPQRSSVLCRSYGLRTQVKQEKYGGAHQFKWKKVGLSRAYYHKQRVCEASMPTDRSRAALRFLLANNAFYKVFHQEQQRRPYKKRMRPFVTWTLLSRSQMHQ